MDIDNLRKFIIESNKTGYASGESGKKEADGSNTIIYESGDWKSHDNYFGGEPYGGRVIVSHKGKPFWIMVYYGKVEKTIKDFSEVYSFLRKAISIVPEDYPFRGPAIFRESGLTYRNKWSGDIKNFLGKETIFKEGKRIYIARYLGGLVDQH